MSIPVSIQLFTLRDELTADFIGTLEQVAAIGYSAVEFYGGFFGGLKSSELKALLQRLGLTASGAHIPMDMLMNDLESITDYLIEIGARHITFPWLVASEVEGKAGWIKLAESLEKIGRECRKKGLVFSYHNHDFEFVQYDGQYVMDIIFEHTSVENVKLELDTYWAQFAGVDPVDYIRSHADRIVMIHQKDMRPSDRKFCEIGNGIMDIAGIHKLSSEIGVQWFIVEQDSCEGSALDSIRISLDNLKKLGLA